MEWAVGLTSATAEMPSEADALEEKTALFHKSKPNSTDNNQTARTSPTLRKILPDPQSVTYKDWRFPPI